MVTTHKSVFTVLGIFLLLGLSSHHAISSEWVLVGADTHSRVFMDTQSIKNEVIMNDAYTRAWFRREYVAPQIIWHEPYRSVIILGSFRCAERTSATVQATYYDDSIGTRMVFHAEGSYLGAVVFEEVTSGSIGEAMLNAACLQGRVTTPKK